MSRVVAALACGASLLSFAVQAQAADPALIATAKAFGTREAIQSMDVSPSGRWLLEVASGPRRSSILRIIDAHSGSQRAILRSGGDPESIYWCGFATDTQLICKYGAFVKIDGEIVGFTRLMSVSSDGKIVKQLGQRDSWKQATYRQFDGSILDWLPDQPGSVLMARNYDRIDLNSLKISQVEKPREQISGYRTDGRGNVRVAEISETSNSSGELTGRLRYRYRKAGSREWTPLGEYNVTDGSGMYPLAIDGGSDSLYFLQKTNGRDALYRMRLDGSGAKSLVAANDKVDIDSVVRFGRGQKIIGYTYTDDRRRTVYFDPEYSKLATGIAKAIGNQPVVTFAEASADGNKLLVFASGDKQPGAYYLFDRKTKQLTEAGLVRPQVQGRALASVKPISIPAPDGTSIPAYLTLPPNGSGKNLPTVVLPHGGPSARDEWSFDWLAQFLAARGYAVIQPNYRGSAGYGDKWLGDNAIRNWRQAIADVSASARYLVGQAIADPNRLAIVGWSYGGYAALQSAAVEPTLYKAAVAIAPVTDLSLLKREADGFTNASLVKEMVGSGEHLRDGSPLRNAAAIKAPVLLVHGDMDGNVGILHSDRMHSALTKAGVNSELMRFKDLDHQLDDSDARVQMLTRIGEFLDSAIGQ